MLRRPLVRPHDQFNFLARFMAPRVGLPDYMVHAPESLYRFQDARAVAHALGFESDPAARAFYPANPLPGQHPTAFLQWGWAADNRQIAFEMGDASAIMSAHFIRQDPGVRDAVWTLDVLEIDDGQRDRNGQPITYHLPCDEAPYAPLMKTALLGMHAALRHLNRDDWRTAQDAFGRAARGVTRELDTIADRMYAEHQAALNMQARPARGPGQTP